MTNKQDCDQSRLTLFHYSELDEAEQQKLQRHLASCQSCSAELARLKTDLAQLPDADLQLSAADRQTFTAQVMAKTGKSFWLRRPVWGSALAVAGALMLALVIMPDKNPAPVNSPALAELEILEQLELLQEMELLEDLELLEALEDLG